MSKIDDLIKQYCPNGVEYEELGEVCEFKRGKNLSKDVKGLGDIPIVLYGELYTTYGNYIKEIVSKTSFEIASKGTPAYKTDILMPITSTTKEAQIGKASALEVQETVYVGGDAIVLSHKQNSGYMVHLLNGKWFEKLKMEHRSGTTVSHLSPKGISKIRIPVPPLPVQEEIVRILDTFSSLEAELEAELAARKKQYEYYLNKLLIFDENITGEGIRLVPLSQVADITKLAGFEFTKYITYKSEGKIIALRGLNVRQGYLDLKDVKYIDGSGITKLTRSKLYKNDMLFTYVGTIGNTALIDKDDVYYLAPNVSRIRFNQNVLNPKFALHYFQSNRFIKTQINKYLNSSSMKNLTMENIRKFIIPIPPLEEQERIVAILDKFDSLVNDISEGLPAELTARRQQYEYYRNKLLTFDEAA